MSLAPATRARLQASLACSGTLALWWWRGGVGPAALAGLMTSLALLAWTSPPRYAPVQRFLDHLIHLLLTALTWLLLGLVYLLVFTPLRFFCQLTGKDPLEQKPDPSATTYLRTPGGSGRFDRQF
jgi:hypothetical protein